MRLGLQFLEKLFKRKKGKPSVPSIFEFDGEYEYTREKKQFETKWNAIFYAFKLSHDFGVNRMLSIVDLKTIDELRDTRSFFLIELKYAIETYNIRCYGNEEHLNSEEIFAMVENWREYNDYIVAQKLDYAEKFKLAA